MFRVLLALPQPWFFTAYRTIADDDPDLVLHLGGYQYEGTSDSDDVRQTAGPETVTWPSA